MSADLANVLASAAEARARLWPEAGGIHYRSPGPLPPALRKLVLANRDALLAHLGEWDGAEAYRLIDGAGITGGEWMVVDGGADPNEGPTGRVRVAQVV